MNLADEFARLCATPSDIYQHLPTLVDLVHELDAEHVIELGTRTGVSTVAFLHALTSTRGRLTSVDLDPAPDIPPQPNWTHIQGDDLDPDILAGLDTADLVFVDTSHLYEQTVAELNVYRWLVRPGGRIVCHDTELPVPEGAPHGHPLFPVRRAVDGFCRANGYRWTNLPWCWGLGIIEID